MSNPDISKVRHDLLSDLGAIFGVCEAMLGREELNDEYRQIFTLIADKKIQTIGNIEALLKEVKDS